MENIWGCAWHRTAGLFGTSTGYSYKLTHGTVDGSTATSFGTKVSGYISINTAKPETGFVTKMLFGKHGMLPSAATGGSATTYYSDYYYDGTGFSLIGGAVNADNACGFGMTLLNDSSSARWSIATSLSLKPRAKVPYNPDWDNRPAHQFVNGQFVDIPTHHYTNGRWQGELTSQSPLKFWADGQMLDWRVEGRTSGNLWDGTFINTSGWGVSFSLDDEGYMVASSSSNDPRDWGYASSQIKMTLGAGTYALVLQGIPPTQSWSGAMIYTSGGSALANNQNLVNKPLIIMPFTLAKETSIGIMVKVVNGKYRVQLLEGTYIASTIPPYEPYGGVGDWDETEQKYVVPVTVNGTTTNIFTDHQLMDGDSIDFSTTETTIPLATGNNVLTVDTAVQPKSVFVKFEG